MYCSHYRPWKPGPHRQITYILMYCSHYRPWKPGPHRQITYILPEFDHVSESPLARVVNVVSIARQTRSYLHWAPINYRPQKKIGRGQGNVFTHVCRVATAQGKQGIWFLLFPDRENTGNFALTQGKILRHRENVFLWHREKFRQRENIWLWLLK